jgi:hypothetical protein
MLRDSSSIASADGDQVMFVDEISGQWVYQRMHNARVDILFILG